ncbi:MAG: hypothetical protein M3N26_01645 [Pseudomonadota bacterium]|nr:hypothetical protein [Pseudomonadota bacterium]
MTFDLFADAGPGLLPRVLVPFARRDLAVDQLRARRSGDAMHVTAVLDAMPAEMVQLIEGNLRQIIGMRRVEVVLRGYVRAVA